MHGGSGRKELDRLINRLKEIRDEEGRTGLFEIHVMSADAYTPDGIKRLEDKGVTDAIVGFRNPTSWAMTPSRWTSRSAISKRSPKGSSPA